MPYPFCRGDDRLCRDLFYRQVQRVQDFWDRGGYCTRCHKRLCFSFSCSPRITEQPIRSIWDTRIEAKREQFDYCPKNPYPGIHE